MARHIELEGGLKMKRIRIVMAFAAAGIIASTSVLLADTAVTPAEAEKIKAALEAWGIADLPGRALKTSLMNHLRHAVPLASVD
jgi:hypothetical protein